MPVPAIDAHKQLHPLEQMYIVIQVLSKYSAMVTWWLRGLTVL